MNLPERRKQVKEKELCYNCLQTSHTSRDRKLSACKRCDTKHNSLLCSENPLNQAINSVQTAQSKKGPAKRNSKQSEKNSATSWLAVNNCQLVNSVSVVDEPIHIMPTVLINLMIDNTIIGPFRALCDTGARTNLMQNSVMKYLPTKGFPCRTNLFGIGDSAVQIRKRIDLSIKPWFAQEKSTFALKVSFALLPKSSKWSAIFPRENIRCDAIDKTLIEPLADPLFWRKTNLPSLQFNKVSEHIACQETLLGNVLYGQTSESTGKESKIPMEEKVVYTINYEELDKTILGIRRSPIV